MRIINNLIPIALICTLVTSCKKDVLDINVNPNTPTADAATPALVLPTALNLTGAIYSNPTSNNTFAWAGLWMGHIGYSGNFAIATENVSYNITNLFGGGTWALLYDNIEDYDFVERKGHATGDKFYEAVGKLMKAYNFQTLVDLYNNVPYSEALKGTEVSRPKYDDAKAIYDDIAKRMDTAISLLKSADANKETITGDIMFSGSAAKWLKFANTVKLRLLLRQSEKSDRASYIQSEVAKFGSSPSFLDVDATVNPGYLNTAGKMNPFWSYAYNVSGAYIADVYWAGAYSINFMKSNNDPRIAKTYKLPESGGDYKGNLFGEQGTVNSKTSGFGPGVLKSVSQPAVVMLAAESYFLQAEARLRGWLTTGITADSLYKKGVEASFAFLGLTKAQAQAYYSQPGNKDVNWAATTSVQERLALIIRQKWAALALLNEFEPYNDYRRLHLPADVPLSVSPFSTGAMPTRLLYPQREYETNAENVQAVGTITPTTKVWWMP